MMLFFSCMRWVTFDCYGTLVDWHAGFSSILKPFAAEKTAELERAYHHLEPQIEAERPHLLYKDVLTKALTLAARQTGVTLNESQARLLPHSWSLLPLFADVESGLAGLRAEGYKLGVLTNCDDELFEQTHQAFRKRFDLVITAERVHDYKPSLSHFRYFSRITGVEHAHWVHVATSWFHDLEPARQLGITAIWLDRDGTSERSLPAIQRVHSAAELPQILKNLKQ